MQEVSDHYAVPDLARRILDALAASGKDLEALTVDDLAPLDAFHIRGRPATAELAAEVELGPELTVIDVGCGIGGTSRFLADRFGCAVTGIDLTEEYCRVAQVLSERTGLAQRTRFRHGSALDLPYEAGSFDVAWTEHAQMNIAEKERFYAELARVLRPGGHLVFHDVFAGPATTPFAFPVPWASHPGISHLAAPGEVRGILSALGLEELSWTDVTEPATEFFRRTLADPRPLGLHVLIGPESRTRLGNVLLNLEADRLRVVQGVMKKG